MQVETAEAAVLAAVLDGDPDEADRLLAEFLPGELRTFEDQAHLLLSRIRHARREIR